MTITVRVTGADDYDNHVCALVAGPPGKGKTRFSVTADNSFHLSAEAGLRSIAGANVPNVEIEDVSTLLAMRSLLAQGPEIAQETLGHEIGTVVIDTIDEIQRIVIGERLRSENKDILGPGDWSWLNDQMNSIIRGFRSLPYHVIFIGHVKDTTDGETGAVNYKLDLSGAIAHQLPAAVDLSMLLTDKPTYLVDDNGETIEERKSFLFTAPMARYDWLKDRSGTLPAEIELNFEDDWESIVTLVNSREFETHEPVEIVIREAETEDEAPEAAQATPATQPSRPDPAAQIVEADKIVEEAEVAKAAAKAGDIVERAQLTEPSVEEEAEIDLSGYADGEGVTLEGDIPLGYKLGNSERVMQVKGYRTIYEIDGEKILSVNELQKGVKPKPNPELKTGIFCQETGEEVTADDSNLSRIRFRKIYSPEVFQAEVNKLKR